MFSPESTQYREYLDFQGVVQGIHSFNESVFEPGKLMALKVREGQEVVKGEVLARLYSPVLAERLEQADAGLKRAESQLGLDQQAFVRHQSLYREKLVSQQALDEAKNRLEAARQTAEEARAGVAQARNELSDSTIRAREAGVISAIFKREGDFINPGEAVLRFEVSVRQKAVFSVPERVALQMHKGASFSVFVPATGKWLRASLLEKSLPTQDGVRQHKVTLAIEGGQAELVGLRVVLRIDGAPVHAFKLDYRAVRYSPQQQAYLIQAGSPPRAIPVSILSLGKEGVIVKGALSDSSKILLGNDVSLPFNLHSFLGS